MEGNQYLIAANSKRGQLIFNIFTPLDLWIALGGASSTILMFLILKPSSLLLTSIVIMPLLVCSFLVVPIPNYHNIRCVFKNIWIYYFVEQQSFRWKGWCAKDEFK